MFHDLKDKKPQNSGENWVAPNATNHWGRYFRKKTLVFGLMQY